MAKASPKKPKTKTTKTAGVKKAPVKIEKATKVKSAKKVAPKILSKESFEDASTAIKPITKPVAKVTVGKSVTTTVKSPVVEKKIGNYFYANGKRKTSVAMVRLYTNGKGTITINGRTFEDFFPVLTDQDKILSPLKMTQSLGVFDISVQVHGGGVHSQAEAIRHGISKALLGYKLDLRTTLKHAGFLTRDSRIKERKKYGLRRARRAPQWAKR